MDCGPSGAGQSIKVCRLGVAKEEAVSQVMVINLRWLLSGLRWEQSVAVMHWSDLFSPWPGQPLGPEES